MTEPVWSIPPATTHLLAQSPSDRPVVVLLRHSVRDDLAEGDVGYAIPITDAGRRIAQSLGNLLGRRLQTLHSSPLIRCIQTAEALAEGAGVEISVTRNRLLGDPGVFVLDGRRAWANWERLGNTGVMRQLVTDTQPMFGMARPNEGARFLVHSMLAAAEQQPGIHVFVTHDSVLMPAAARLLGEPLGLEDWPAYLEGALFWRTGQGVHAAYRDKVAVSPDPICSLTECHAIEFARREIAATVGFDSGARFFLAGGAFKSLLTGRTPRDLDLWAPSARDRVLLLEALRARGAKPAEPRPFADAFEIEGRQVEIPHSTSSATLDELLGRFDIGLSAVGVEHGADGEWSTIIHPLALESLRRREILLLKPLFNWKYALTTLERMRRYAAELGFSVPSQEEDEVWRVFDMQDGEMRKGMIERYLRTGSNAFGVMEEIAHRCS